MVSTIVAHKGRQTAGNVRSSSSIVSSLTIRFAYHNRFVGLVDAVGIISIWCFLPREAERVTIYETQENNVLRFQVIPNDFAICIDDCTVKIAVLVENPIDNSVDKVGNFDVLVADAVAEVDKGNNLIDDHVVVLDEATSI